MAEYRIIVEGTSDEQLGEFNKFRNLNFGKKVNNYGQCKFDIPVSDPKANALIALRRYKIKILRNGSPIWRGEQASRIGDLNEQGDNWVSLTAFGFFEQLSAKYTDELVEITGEDQGQVSSDLIDGAFGITEGTIETTRNIDKELKNQNVADTIRNLANNSEGFNFEVNDSKIYNVYEFLGVDRSASVILEYGVNVTSVRISEDFSKIVTRAIVLGDSGDAGDPLRIVVDDAGLQALYGVREGILNELQETDEATLTLKGEAFIRKHGLPLLKISTGDLRGGINGITIEDFALGDLIRVKVKKGIYNIDSKFRIYEWSISLGEDNTENLRIVLSDFNNPEEA